MLVFSFCNCSSVCHFMFYLCVCVCVCARVLYMLPWIIIMTVISTVKETPISCFFFSICFFFFLLQLLMQSHLPCSGQSCVPRRNEDVCLFFVFPSCERSHVTHCEFASQPNLCSGERAVIRFESALGKTTARSGGE